MPPIGASIARSARSCCIARRRWSRRPCRRSRCIASRDSMPFQHHCSISREIRPTPASSGTSTSGRSSKTSCVLRFLARRLLQAVPLLLVISILVFLLIHLAPGGPLAIYLSNPNVRPQDIERLRHALGLDRPLWQQYVSWLTAFARGDWGYSYSDGRLVTDRILERLPASVELVASSLVAAFVLAVPVGVVSAA